MNKSQELLGMINERFTQLTVNDLIKASTKSPKSFKYSDDLYDHLTRIQKQIASKKKGEVGLVDPTELMDYCDNLLPARG